MYAVRVRKENKSSLTLHEALSSSHHSHVPHKKVDLKAFKNNKLGWE